MSDKQNIETPVSVGNHLKHLREKKKISVAEVAAQLYLKPDVIEALERDDYTALPSEAYARGYLRNYAKILGAPADSFSSLYESDATGAPKITPEVKLEKTIGENKLVVAFSYFLVFILILLLFIWWQNDFTHFSLESKTLTHSTNNGLRDSDKPPRGLSYSITVVEHSDSPFYRAPSAEESPEATSSEYDESGGSAFITGNIDPIGSGPDSIKMVLSANSWIEVFDANNEKVYYDLARTGQTLTLNGTAPFSILLGFSQGVTVEFNGVAFDPAPYSSRVGIARFVLGE